MNVKKRIAVLEDRMLPNFISLRMADGSIHKILGGVNLARLYCDLSNYYWELGQGNTDQPSPEEILQKHPDLQKILNSVDSDESVPMINLIKGIARGIQGFAVERCTGEKASGQGPRKG